VKSEVRETAPLKREVDIQLEAAEVKAFIDQVIGAYRSRYSFPGFRPGKAPAALVMKRFHDEIEQAVLQELVPRKIEEVLAEQKIHPAGPGKMSRIRYEPDQPMSFSVELEIWPEIELKSYEGLSVDQLVEEVSVQEVDQYLNWMRDRLADLTPVDRPAQADDLLDVELETIDVHGERLRGTEKQKLTLEVGSPSLLPEFRQAADGIQVGEVQDLKVEYPEDFSQEELRGQTRRYRFRATQIREKKVPPLDDDFAGKVEADLDLDGLRAKVRLRLESEKRLASREKLEQQIVDRLIRENPFDLPEGSIKAALERLEKRHADEGREMSAEEIERIYRPHVERAHRRELILAKVAERESIRVGRADAEAEIARLAKREDRKPEQVREDIGDVDRFRDFLFERRVFETLAKKVTVREVMVPSSAAEDDRPVDARFDGGEKESADE